MAGVTPKLKHPLVLKYITPALLRIVNWQASHAGDMSKIQRVKDATRVSLQAIEEARRVLEPGMTERQLHDKITAFVKAWGYRMGFPLLCAAGPNTANIHARAGRYTIQTGDTILIDIGLKRRLLADWSSDVTRTFFVGKPSAFQEKIYFLVQAANRAAVKIVRAGRPAALVDHIARKIIEDAGYTIPHTLGHAVGRYSHNAPLLAQGNFQRLAVNQVITIEPGIYLPGKFGIRIEDIVVVKKNGCEVLSEPSIS